MGDFGGGIYLGFSLMEFIVGGGGWEINIYSYYCEMFNGGGKVVVIWKEVKFWMVIKFY